jgi:capsular exopolysaccharide synthesis family protein
VTEVGTTNVAQIAVRSTDPVFAAAAANAYATAYINVSTNDYLSSQAAAEKEIQAQINTEQAQINALEQAPATSQTQAQIAGLTNEVAALNSQLTQLQLVTAQGANAGELVVRAVPDYVPVSPKRVQDAVIAAAVGLLLGLGFALLRDHLDDRIRDAADLENAASGLPTVGLIPPLPDWRDRKSPFLVSAERPRSPAAEAYRALRTSVKFMGVERPVKLLQVTSPGATEGKTTTAANLAYAMAGSNQRVVLVDCDLRRPRVHEFFHLPNTVGLTSFLLGDTPIEAALQRVPGNPGLVVLPSGPIPPNPSELLSGDRAAWLFQYLADSADVVVLDSSPVLPVTDAVVLAARVDGVLLVAAAGVSTARGVNASLELLGRVDARVVGTVLNRAPEATGAYGYGYGYAYGGRYSATYEPGAHGNGNGNGHGTGNGNGAGNSNGAGVWPAHARRDTP